MELNLVFEFIPSLKEVLSKEDTDKIEILDIEKFVLLEHKERADILSKLLGDKKSELFLKHFEKLFTIENQKKAFMKWLDEDHEIKPEYREDIITRLSWLKETLSPKELKRYCEELDEIRIGAKVTVKEAENILKLSKEARKAKEIMDKGGSKADYENTSNAYKKYIEYLKKDPKK